LFSRDDVATFINKNFEPVWQSVRPVPIVRIDFGNGTVLTRTLHGNIATYGCTAEGQVLDVVAGIYAPAAYLERLTQLRLLGNYVDQQGPARRAERLRSYHQGQLEALKKNVAPPVFVNVADRAKKKIEGGVLAVLTPGGRRPAVPVKADDKIDLRAPDDLANWKVLARDTQVNELVRRRQVHEMLAGAGLARPESLTKRIYKDVLNADLDDPYLGQGGDLFAGYPFKDDKKTP
jgi:hypothetical protein